KKYLQKKGIASEELSAIKNYHQEIAGGLFNNDRDPVFSKINGLFADLENFMEHNKSTQYDFVYDQIVSYGELLSTVIVSDFLKSNRIDHSWLDARQLIKTNSTYRDATVNWEETQQKVLDTIKPGK